MKQKNNILLFFVFPFAALAQDINAQESLISGAIETTEIYYIQNIAFDIEGRTKPFAILRAAEMREGEEIAGSNALTEYLARKTQLLNNQRTLAEATIDFIIGEKNEDDRIPVDLLIHVRDSRNFVIFPKPKYSSSSGWAPSINARDYNFLGTNSPLRATFGYGHTDDDNDAYPNDNVSFLLESNVPFSALGLIWNFKFDHDLKYFFNENASYKNITGLSVDLPWKRTTFTIGYDQGVSINEEYDDCEKYFYNKNLKDLWFVSSGMYALWKMPTGVRSEMLGELVYQPEIRANINYSQQGMSLGDHNGPDITLRHETGFDKVDWIGNFRKGYVLRADNANSYNVYFDEWTCDIGISAIGHFILTDYFGISARLVARHWFDDNRHAEDKRSWDSGTLLRGVGDKEISADSIVTLNLDASLLVFAARPSEWLDKIRKDRTMQTRRKSTEFFNFEFRLGPFLDIALADGRRVDAMRQTIKKISFAPEDWLIAGGFEALIFPLSFRSIFLRFSMGWNFKSGNDEISIDIGHFY